MDFSREIFDLLARTPKNVVPGFASGLQHQPLNFMLQVVRVIVPLVLDHRRQRLYQEAQHQHDGRESRECLDQRKHLSSLPSALPACLPLDSAKRRNSSAVRIATTCLRPKYKSPRLSPWKPARTTIACGSTKSFRPPGSPHSELPTESQSQPESRRGRSRGLSLSEAFWSHLRSRKFLRELEERS